jgi:integrase
MGMIYPRGNIYWIKYYRNGKPFFESTKSKKKMVAKKLLEQREGEISQGKIPGVYFDKIRFGELAEDFLADYRINQKKSLVRAKRSINHLNERFEGVRVTGINTPKINRYIEYRMNQGASSASINRELAALKRLFNLGARCTPPKVDRVPFIPMLKENNIRKGFFEHGEFLALRDALPAYLKGFITFAYKTGWRKSEIANLTWKQVDLNQGIVTLNPGETKNDDGRTIYLDDELKVILEQQLNLRKGKDKILPYVFLNKSGNDRIKDFRVSWDKACSDAGIGKKLFHDFRRTAARNIVRSGTPERVAMTVTGHKTRSVFDRYNIVSDKDLKLAAQRQEKYLNSQNGYKKVTIGNFVTKKEASQ